MRRSNQGSPSSTRLSAMTTSRSSWSEHHVDVLAQVQGVAIDFTESVVITICSIQLITFEPVLVPLWHRTLPDAFTVAHCMLAYRANFQPGHSAVPVCGVV